MWGRVETVTISSVKPRPISKYDRMMKIISNPDRGLIDLEDFNCLLPTTYFYNVTNESLVNKLGEIIFYHINNGSTKLSVFFVLLVWKSLSYKFLKDEKSGTYKWKTTKCYFKSTTVWFLMSVILFTSYCVGAAFHELSEYLFCTRGSQFNPAGKFFRKLLSFNLPSVVLAVQHSLMEE